MPRAGACVHGYVAPRRETWGSVGSNFGALDSLAEESPWTRPSVVCPPSHGVAPLKRVRISEQQRQCLSRGSPNSSREDRREGLRGGVQAGHKLCMRGTSRVCKGATTCSVENCATRADTGKKQKHRNSTQSVHRRGIAAEQSHDAVPRHRLAKAGKRRVLDAR